MEKIKSAAIKNGTNITTGEDYGICLSRQPAVRKAMLDRYGFLTTSGRFVSAADAYTVAVKAGQISRGPRTSMVLFPEDL